MTTFPKVDTVKSILSKINIKGEKLTEKEISRLIKLKLGKDLLFTLKDRNFILDAVGLINQIGFDNTYEHLKKYSKESVRFNIIKNSDPFLPAKQRFFLEITKDLRTVNIESAVKCKKCKEYKVDTVSKQVRSADEGETTFHKCRNCGYQWND